MECTHCVPPHLCISGPGTKCDGQRSTVCTLPKNPPGAPLKSLLHHPPTKSPNPKRIAHHLSSAGSLAPRLIPPPSMTVL